MKALIVDDSGVSRRILFGILQHDCEIEDITQLSDGANAVEVIKGGDFNLVLLDWNMPEVQGIEVLERVRAAGLSTPVIMVAGEKDRAHVLRAFEAGAKNYTIKPFEPASLAEKVQQVLQVHGR